MTFTPEFDASPYWDRGRPARIVPGVGAKIAVSS